jgi:hypothetical protein
MFSFADPARSGRGEESCLPIEPFKSLEPVSSPWSAVSWVSRCLGRCGCGCKGVCHSDVLAVEGLRADPSQPIVPGHEIVGVIDEVGAAVSLAGR